MTQAFIMVLFSIELNSIHMANYAETRFGQRTSHRLDVSLDLATELNSAAVPQC
jgi:hypothetical protein